MQYNGNVETNLKVVPKIIKNVQIGVRDYKGKIITKTSKVKQIIKRK